MHKNIKRGILFIGMGDLDLEQLYLAKSYSFYTIVTNKNPNSKALKYADLKIIANGKDIHGILLKIYSLDIKIVAIYTGTELFTSASIIAKALGIKWHSIKSSTICEHKSLMKKEFINNNIKCPNGIVVSQIKDIIKFINNSSEKVFIIKPSDSLSSKGVTIIDNSNQIKDAFEYALEHSNSKKIIIEEFINGTLHDVNGILSKDKFYPLGINDKKAGCKPHAVVVEVEAPSKISVQQQHELYERFFEDCKKIGLSDGPLKGDYILDSSGEFYTMELAPRLHGPLGSIHIIPKSLKINPFEEYLKNILNFEVNVHIPNNNGKHTIIKAVEDISISNNYKNVTDILKLGEQKKEKDWKSNNDVPYYVVYHP